MRRRRGIGSRCLGKKHTEDVFDFRDCELSDSTMRYALRADAVWPLLPRDPEHGHTVPLCHRDRRHGLLAFGSVCGICHLCSLRALPLSRRGSRLCGPQGSVKTQSDSDSVDGIVVIARSIRARVRGETFSPRT